MIPFHFTVAAAAAALPAQTEVQLRFVTLLQRGTLSVELYVVIAGHGEFLNGEERHPFQAGDLLFVPAGVEHRFLSFSDDFQTWVIFYGPRGGELPASRQPSDAPAYE
jgi:mannose-6-phosphate isomerase-like protein (cupin superfamily)